MDPLDIAVFDSLSGSIDHASTDNSEPATKTFDEFDDLFGSGLTDSSASTQPSAPKLSSAKGHNLLFSFDESPSAPGDPGPPPGINDLLAGFDSGRDDESAGGGSFFDDLLDFTPSSQHHDRQMDMLEEEPAVAVLPVSVVTPVSGVDLLFGVDNGLESSLIKSHQDIPDVADSIWTSSSEAPEVPKMQADDIFSDAFEDSFVIISKELVEDAYDVGEKKKEDEKKDEVKADKSVEEDKEVSVPEDKVDGIPRGSTGDDSIDFSVLELPGTEHLNFELSKHKRSLSQKGSIARRKRPTRAAIQGVDDVDRIYIDSTEPKLPRSPLANEVDGFSSPKSEELHKVKLEEESPKDQTKKFSGGVKIPGLLEGLSKSKVFSKSEKSEPEPVVKTQVSKVPVPTARTSAPVDSTSSPLTRPKPVILPRVLPSIIPKSTSKTLKDSQNHSTAGESNPVKPHVLSQADAKQTTTPEKPSRDLKLTTPLGVGRVLPSKPELPTAGSLSKPTAKVPPPVPSKPSAPVKPTRSGLYGSASFSAADRNSSTFNKKTVIPSLAQKNEESVLPDVTNSPQAQNAENKAKVLPSVEKISSPYSSLTNKSTNPDSSTLSRTPLSESETTRNSGITRTSSLRTNTVGYLDRLKYRPGESSHKLDQKKTESLEGSTDILGATNKNSFESGIMSAAEKSDHGEGTKDEPVVLRKSSISGISSVKSPSINDKSQSNTVTRRGSFTGSAYNPIGFRPTVTGIDGEASKSRGNSVSSNEEVTITSAKPASVSENKPSIATETSSRPSLVTGDNPTTASLALSHSSTVLETKSAVITVVPSKLSSVADTKPSNVIEPSHKPTTATNIKTTQHSFSSSEGLRTSSVPSVDLKTSVAENKDTKNSIVATVSSEDKSKETADESNKNIKNQTKDLKDYSSPLKANGRHPETTDKTQTSNEKVSPWNVRLRKVEKKEKTPEPETIKSENLTPAVDWRQQMAQKRRSVASPKGLAELEKPKQDSAPEWARASIHRRQRLIESGIIKAEGQ